VFEALSAAFQHVVQRQALAKPKSSGDFASPSGSAGGGGGASGSDGDEMDPDAAAQFLLRAAETLASAMAQHIGVGDEIIGDNGAARSEAAALVDDVAAGFTSTVARMGGLSLSANGSGGGGTHESLSANGSGGGSYGLSLRVDSLEKLATASTQCLTRLTRLIEADDGIAAAKQS